MNFITDWVSQVVFFIFLATIISLLIPSTAHDKAIKLVFGLVIFLLFLYPLTELFNVNPNEFVNEWEASVENIVGEDLEDEINSKKNEIQASQHAYILEQLEQEVITLVEPDLEEEFGYAIQNLSINLEEGINLNDVQDPTQYIDSIAFQFNEKSDNHVEEIESITIPNKNETEKNSQQDQEIKQQISSKLNLSSDQIKIIWEGDS
ncbi:stage III sporulation protein AF [Aquisalibacillus elongatus]|uniref:Stage III sporulation protein AF n=1 Tax=Aquisalibacillus elongatus TaxID=485577 RepID=A0A3N5BK75_9BACI|nr:stage III sporulation protein AF [Aquisalibacillus elongatus]RPF55660.1 stage III sporulation protein AF [Aquisalibacillus elongatus]